ncbi:MAG: glycosyltransferase [Clostridiales bacterium]|nr:glycosyltransferase [Clostridiales bacterium]
MTKVSIIIPIYNMDAYLGACLDSVLGQSLEDIEIICVNDGSTDGSAEIAKHYREQDGRIAYIEQENQGVAQARNAGLKAATGEFVCFMDPDDLYPDTDVLKDLYGGAKENNVKICGGSFSSFSTSSSFVDGTDEVNTVFEGKDWGYVFSEDRLWDYEDYQFDYGFHRFIYDRKMLAENNIKFPPYIRFQDPPFFVNAMMAAGRFYSLARVSYRYRIAHKETNWDGAKLASALRGVTDNLRISQENGLCHLHALTLRRPETIYAHIERELRGECSSDIKALLLELDGHIDGDMIRLSRFGDADIEMVQRLLSNKGKPPFARRAAKAALQKLGLLESARRVLQGSRTNVRGGGRL